MKIDDLPVYMLSSFGHAGIDWTHSLLDMHKDIIIMPAFSFFRTLHKIQKINRIQIKNLSDPKYASEIPHEFLSTVKFEDEEQIILNELLNKLPNITYIKLSDYINKTKNFLDKMFIISIFMSGLVVAIGLVVVSNAMSVMTNLKVYQNLVFRILGFERSGIIKLIMFESLIIFIPIIFFSLFFAILLSYMLIVNFFNIWLIFNSISVNFVNIESKVFQFKHIFFIKK